MAGVQAGTLNIQILADVARITQDMERVKRLIKSASGDIANNAKAANDNLSGIGKGASAGLVQFSREVARLKSQMDPAWASLQRYKQEVFLLSQAYRQGAISQEQYTRGLQQTRSAWQAGAQGVTQAAGSQRAGLQQLGFQLGDISQQFAAGVKPQIIFAQQSGQVIQALSLMTNGARGLLGFLGGPWGMIISAAAVALIPLISRLLETENAASRAKSAIQSVLADYREFVTQNAKVAEAQTGLNNLLTRQADLQEKINARPKDSRGNPMFSYKDQKELLAVNQEIMESRAALAWNLQQNADKDTGSIQQMIAARAKLAGATTAADRAQGQYNIRILEAQQAFEKSGKTYADQQKLLEAQTAAELDLNRAQDSQRAANAGAAGQRRIETLARETAATEALISGLRNVAAAYQQSEAAGLRAQITAEATEKGMRKQADISEYVSQQIRKVAAERTASAAEQFASLRSENDALQINNGQVRQGIMSAQEAQEWMQKEAELRPYTIALALAEGEAKKELTDIIKKLGDEIDRNNLLNKESEDAKRVEQHKRDMKLLEGELELTKALGDSRLKALRGLTGDSLEDELARINLEHEKATILLRAQAQAAELTAQGLHGMAAAALEAAQAQMKMADVAFEYEKAEVGIERYNDRLRDTIGLLQDIGGIGGVLGGILGIVTGNTDAIGGRFGDLLRIGVKGDDGKFRKLGDVLSGAIGNLGSKLTGALQSAGQGIMAGAAAFGKQGTGGMVASGLGGILGQIGGQALAGTVSSAIGGALGAAIGSAVPVIGTILGGIAGGALMKMIGGAQRGSAIISGGQVSGAYGNSSKFKDQANEIAGGLLDTMQQIATQFGTTLDAQAMGSLSIGVRDGKYAVDTLGRGYTKSSIEGVKSFGTDAEAAVQYALELMLERGAIAMREGSMKIIKEATDLEEGLTRALQFEEIMNMLDGSSSQLVSQVKAVRAQFEQYISVMKQAGAATEDLARVQAMQAEQIKAIIAAAGDSYRSQFYTDSENVAFAQQQIKAVLDPLGKGAIDTVAEYMREVERAQTDTSDAGLAYLGTLYELADQFGILKDAADAAAAQAAADRAQREADRAAAAAELQRQTDDAKSALKQAYDREAGELGQTIESFGAFADSLADFRRELFAGEGAANGYAQKLAELRRVGGLAGMGDEAALSALPGVGRDFLGASRNRSGTLLQYQRDVALVARYAGTAEQAARGMVSEAQKQLDALDRQVGKLIEINESVLSVEQAIRDLYKIDGSTPSTGNSRPSFDLPDWFGGGRNIFDGLFASPRRDRESDEGRTIEALDRVEQRLAVQEENTRRAADSSFAMNKLLQRLSPDGETLQISQAPA